MDLKARARKLREQADAATAEASARWDDFVQARTALEALEDGVDITAAPEFAAAQAAQETYDAAAEASRSAEREYRAVLELMGDDAPERPVTQVAQREAASPVSIGDQFTQSGVFREVSARIPETAGSKQAIGTTASVRVADREQARDIMRRPQATIFSTPDNVVAPDQAPGIRPLPLLPPLTVLDLITMATTDSTSVKWVREKAFTNAAAEVAETTAATDEANTTIKPESALQLEPVTFDVTTTDAAGNPVAADVGVFNQYPKDTEFMHLGHALHVLNSASRPLVREGGTTVIISAASDGLGYHSLEGPYMRHEHKVSNPRLAGRNLVIMCNTINRRQDCQSICYRQGFIRNA